MSSKINDEARRRAAKALANAKQRCTNKNNPDYPTYGGAGVQMLIAGCDQLVAHIGLPKPGHSLDRIDPNGNYAVGNVRWASAAVQQANKKSSAINQHFKLAAQVAAAQETLASRDYRKIAAVGWIYALRAFNRGFLPAGDAQWMAENLPCPGLLEASLDFDTVYDWTHPEPGFVHLPALSLPGARVRLRCGAAVRLPASTNVEKYGRLAGLEALPADWNIPPSLWKRLCGVVTGNGAGLAVTGIPDSKALLGGWIEGSFLAAASCIPAVLGVAAACFPLMRVQKMVVDLGSPEFWDEVDHPLLSVQVLLIPDLSLDSSIWGDGHGISWWKIGELLRRRYDDGLQTIVGVQNAARMPSQIKEVILGAYGLFAMPPTAPHPRAHMAFSDSYFGVPQGQATLRAMKHDAALSHLVVHDGLDGT